MALAIGVFDGMHLGHLAVLHAARTTAAAQGGQAWALTFEPHPRQVIRPDSAPVRVMSPSLKLDAFAAAGMHGVIVLPFTPDQARQSAEDFVEHLVSSLRNLAAVAVGVQWHFGHQAHGTVELLKKHAATHGFSVLAVPPVLYGGHPISSTRVREAVRSGHLAEAAAMLGRPFALRGPVTHGRAVGRALGYPTANISALDGLHPPAGVYAARVELDNHATPLPAAAYIGRRPSFETDGVSALEVYVFDFEGNLYDRVLTVHLLERLRGDQSFPNEEALKHQISLDVARCRAIASL